MKKKLPHPVLSALPLLTLIGTIVLVMTYFPDDALSGASQIAMLIASSVCIAISMLIYKTKWHIFERHVMESFKDISLSIMILFLIGMMSSTWMICGVVPTLIYYGVQLMSPVFFLPCACIISAIISLMTGSSWTTVATIGIALLGIGNALDMPSAFTAGAVISGAYFGDKMSPMSDTTVLASSVAGADLFRHIRYMMFTTVPSLVIALLLYLVMGIWYSGDAVVEPEMYMKGLSNAFNISLWTLLVPAFTGFLIYKKVPSLLTLFLATIAACICAVILQSEVLVLVAGATDMTPQALFTGLMKTCYAHTSVETGYSDLNSLVSTRGMAGMLDTVWLILCAIFFGACMVASKMLNSITNVLLNAIRNTVTLVASTVFSGVLLNVMMGDQFLSIIMNASIFKNEYARRGYNPELLSRSTEDSSTVTSVLVPWTACGMTQSTVLGIPTLVFAPFCFFNIISPFMSCIVAALGFVPKPQPQEEKAEEVAEA